VTLARVLHWLDAMSEKRQIRYAVVGAGHIAQVAVLPAFAHAEENSRLVAVVSGDADKRAALRERYGLELDGDYGSFETVLEEGDIDAVYIATPNSKHKELALRAAASGVHVLCEKPLAPTSNDCREIIDACDANEVKLMVGYRLHFEEANLEAAHIARSGKLGEVRLFSSFFTHVVRPDDVRRDPTLAGGACYDLGVYCINAARNIFEAEPESVSAQVVERNGTDDMTLALVRFPGDRVAQFCVANSISSVSSYRIGGTDGDLRVEPAYEYVDELVHYLTIEGKTERRSFRRGDQFAPELKYFSECILNGREPEPSGEEGFCDVRVIEAILESARIKREVPLAPYIRTRRPTLDQADHVRPVKKPKLVEVESPSLK
jgi:predicted dehydrogenase